MGAGASVPDELDEAACRLLAGERFSKAQFDKLAGVSGTIGRADFLTAAKAAHRPFHTGDIVRARPEGEDMAFEGLVVTIEEETMLIDFGDNDHQHVPHNRVQLLMPWDTLEVGDTIQAKPKGEFTYFEAVCTGVGYDADLDMVVYSIKFEDDETEDGVVETRVRKVRSARSTVVQKWRRAYHAVSTINMMRALHSAHNILDDGIVQPEQVNATVTPASPGSPNRRQTVHKAMSTVATANSKRSLPGAISEKTAAPPAILTASETETAVNAGDVVKAKSDGMWFEGVVLSNSLGSNGKQEFVVEFGDENEPDQQIIKGGDIVKVLPWSHLEIGDRVEARPSDGFMWFSGHVINFHPATQVYDVQFDDEDDAAGEIETNVPEARIRKLQSNRTIVAKERWKKAKTAVVAARAFRAFTLRASMLKTPAAPGA
jgi:hypothetical protein